MDKSYSCFFAPTDSIKNTYSIYLIIIVQNVAPF